MTTEIEALESVRVAWDEHTVFVTRALDKIAKLSALPVSEDNSAKIEEIAAKIMESTKAMSAALDPLDPATPPVEDVPVEDVPVEEVPDETPELPLE